MFVVHILEIQVPSAVLKKPTHLVIVRVQDTVRAADHLLLGWIDVIDELEELTKLADVRVAVELEAERLEDAAAVTQGIRAWKTPLWLHKEYALGRRRCGHTKDTRIHN